MSITGGKGAGIRIEGCPDLEIYTLPYTGKG